MKYLGIDYGTKKVGIAISQGSVALPKGVITNDNNLLNKIESYITQYEVGAIIVGRSLNLSGGDNKLSQKVQDFINKLKTLMSTNIEIHYMDERYTTKLARAIPLEGLQRGNIARKRERVKTKQVDAQAAALILQTYLDKQDNLG